jgi:hypothetical protein
MQKIEHSFTGGFSVPSCQAFSELAEAHRVQGTEHLDNGDLETQDCNNKGGDPALRALATPLKKQNLASGGTEDFTEFTNRIEELRLKRRNSHPLTSEEWAELEDRERLVRELRNGTITFMEAFDFSRCQRKDGSNYGTGGTCQKGVPVKASDEFVLPNRVALLEKLGNGKLPEDKAKRRALYFAAHKRLGVLGNNPTNPKQQSDGHQRERALLNKLLDRLNDEFNSMSQVTRDQMLKAVGTID